MFRRMRHLVALIHWPSACSGGHEDECRVAVEGSVGLVVAIDDNAAYAQGPTVGVPGIP